AACLLFAFADAIQARLQGTPLPLVGAVPVQLIQAIPYVLTVGLLAGFVGRAVAPRAIGVPYVKERWGDSKPRLLPTPPPHAAGRRPSRDRGGGATGGWREVPIDEPSRGDAGAGSPGTGERPRTLLEVPGRGLPADGERPALRRLQRGERGLPGRPVRG